MQASGQVFWSLVQIPLKWNSECPTKRNKLWSFAKLGLIIHIIERKKTQRLYNQKNFTILNN